MVREQRSVGCRTQGGVAMSRQSSDEIRVAGGTFTSAPIARRAGTARARVRSWSAPPPTSGVQSARSRRPRHELVSGRWGNHENHREVYRPARGYDVCHGRMGDSVGHDLLVWEGVSMAISRPCDECYLIKRVTAYREDSREGMAGVGLAYLCRPCARELGYLTSPRRIGGGDQGGRVIQ